MTSNAGDCCPHGAIYATLTTFRVTTTVIPNVCAAFPEVDFLIAGDGPMRGVLETIVKEHGLTKRVTLLGAVVRA